MLNYFKSECYRIFHSPALYLAALGFSSLPLVLNLVLFAFEASMPGYRYATTSFSYSNLVASPMLFCFAALILVYVLYEGNRKNGNLKNAVACGVSREQIFAAQLLASFLASLFVLAIAASVYLLSAELLLRKEGPVEAADLLREIPAVAPAAAASLIFSVSAALLSDKASLGILCWTAVFFLIPQALFYIGLEVEPVRSVAMWMPQNIFSGMEVNQQVCAPVWDTAPGLARCLIAGFAGILLFGVGGVLLFRKKEL